MEAVLEAKKGDIQEKMPWGLLTNDIAIDLGTANTLVYVKGQGIVLNEPSVVAVDKRTGKVLAIGMAAKEMIGRTPYEISAIRPLKDGVIADFEVSEKMLADFIRRVVKHRYLMKPRIIISVPSGITEVEKRAVRDSAENAGAREVFLLPEPMAAAIGVGLPVDQPSGSMIIDVGGGTTEIAVIALNGIVNNTSIRIAGDELDDSIVIYLKKNYNLLIGERTAEEIKCRIGSAYPLDKEETMEIKGRDLVAGVPKTMKISSAQIREAVSEPVANIIEAVRQALEQTPPELASDILDRGIIMTGGGALLRGLDKRLRQETNLPVIVADDPLTCVVRGAGRCLENLPQYSKVLSKSRRD
jgi:rod shape-determining protein MreB